MKSRSPRSQSRSANDEFLKFTSSVEFDRRLWKYDIAGTIAHAHTLANAHILTRKELEATIAALKEIAHKLRSDEIGLDPALEDIHMNIEKLLVDAIGDTGKKIHTGRSRNDQVALDMRLFVRDALLETAAACIGFQSAILAKAEESSGIVMPGYTHLQHAQPVLLSHHLLAYFWKVQRDIERLHGCYSRANISPLGSGALAGTTYKLDRSFAQKMLGMAGTTQNSLDAVSDRDFAAESAFALSLLMLHLSSLSEELVLWSSNEFGFVELPKGLSSGSSIMPQKRNPDLPELVRAKSGRAVGDLVAILTLLKSLPLAYNRDLQEDKESLFDVFDTTVDSLGALTPFLQAIEFDKVRMRKSAEAGLMTATDLADFLTTRGVPFRTAHGLVKEIVEKSGGDETEFLKMADRMVREQLKDFKTSDLNFMSVGKAIERRSIEGGTSSTAVSKQMETAYEVHYHNINALKKMKTQAESIDRLLQ
jgi:argininosuccinate lyase